MARNDRWIVCSGAAKTLEAALQMAITTQYGTKVIPVQMTDGEFVELRLTVTDALKLITLLEGKEE